MPAKPARERVITGSGSLTVTHTHTLFRSADVNTHQTKPADPPAPRWPGQSRPASPLPPSVCWLKANSPASIQRQEKSLGQFQRCSSTESGPGAPHSASHPGDVRLAPGEGVRSGFGGRSRTCAIGCRHMLAAGPAHLPRLKLMCFSTLRIM